MSRPGRWWRPDTNRRPAGGARRRAHAQRGTGEAFDAGYQAGKADQAREDQRLRDGLDQVLRAADAADNGDASLLDALARQAGIAEAVTAEGRLPDRGQYRCPSWCTADHGDPEQLADDLAVRSRGHHADVRVVLRDNEPVAVVSLVAVDNLDEGTRTVTDVAVDARDSYTPAEARQIAAGITAAARIAEADADDLLAVAEAAGATPLGDVDAVDMINDLENWLGQQNGETL